MKIDGYEVRETIYSTNYLVSENGIVYSCFDGNIRKLSLSNWKQKGRNGEKTGIIYKLAHLRINGKTISKSVHRLVAQSFIPNPNNYRCVNHIDGNTLNNSVNNLEWCSNGHNVRHAFSHELINYYKEGKRCRLCGERIGDKSKSGYCRFCYVNLDIGKTKYSISKNIDVKRHKEFLGNLKSILDERDITYKQLSYLTGYAERTIENYMRFQSTSKKVKKKILEVLEINEVGLPVVANQ